MHSPGIRVNIDMAVSFDGVRDVPDKSFLTHYLSFPPCSFGKLSPVTSTLQASWFNHFAWTHYDVRHDGAFWFTCCKAVKTGKGILSGSAEPAFLVNDLQTGRMRLGTSANTKAVISTNWLLLP